MQISKSRKGKNRLPDLLFEIVTLFGFVAQETLSDITTGWFGKCLSPSGEPCLLSVPMGLCEPGVDVGYSNFCEIGVGTF